MRAAGLLSCCLLPCCGPTSAPVAVPDSTEPLCHYEAELVQEQPALLNVRVGCRGGKIRALTMTEPASRAHVHDVTTLDGGFLQGREGRYPLSEARRRFQASYQVDLESVARSSKHFDVAMRQGKSLIAPASSFLLQPQPPGQRKLFLRVKTDSDRGFVSGLKRWGEGYVLGAHELPVATYSVFGRFARREIQLGTAAPSEIDLVVADGPLRLSSKKLTQWVSRSAAAVAAFWGKPPTPRTMIVVIPKPSRRGVIFGKVLPESAPGIALVVGAKTTVSDLYDDWILIHELFHLGFPSFQGEGKWLDEGLATYYEPLIRARAGWKTELSVWEEFVRAMPQGVSAMRSEGLENTKIYRAIYWGGAIVALLADLEIRTNTKGRRGLEDGLREVLRAGGHASEVWSVKRTVAVCDSVETRPKLGALVKRFARRGAPINLEREVWSRLGIRKTSQGLVLSKDPAQRALRHAIVYGSRPGK